MAAADATVVTVDLGATHLRVALSDGRRLGPPRTSPTGDLPTETAPHGGRGIVPAVARAVREAMAAVGDATADDAAAAGAAARSSVLAAGVGIAAFVDPWGDLIAPTPFGVPAGPVLRTVLEDELAVAVVVDNDANMAALGELEAGAGRASTDFVLITLGTNIGGAIVEGGRIRRGAHGIAGELGLILEPLPPGAGRSPPHRAGSSRAAAGGPAPSGYAYLEDLVGGRALTLRGGQPGRCEGPAKVGVFAAAALGDPAAREAVASAIEGWAVLIADVSVVLDPALVIVSGGLVEEAAHFMDPLRRRVSELTPFAPEIRIGELGASAGLVGAAVAARRVAGTSEARHADGAATAT